MRTMLLSFSPKWYDDLSSGRKIYEHRIRFYNDTVCAYIYLGLPYRQIVAKTILGPKQNIADWLTQFKDDPAAIKRIQDYLTRSNVAMPIHSFQAIKPIDAREMEKEIPANKYGLLAGSTFELSADKTTIIQSNIQSELGTIKYKYSVVVK